MELWIRNQNKERLIKANIVMLPPIEEVTAIYCYIDKDTNFWLGTYKTRERALEVIDEIQNYICPNGSINLYDGTRVYEMPKE